MIHETLQWATAAMHGKLHGDPAAKFSGGSTDTRELAKGEIFFCLKAQRDGHDFAQDALRKECAALVIDRDHQSLLEKFPKGSQAIVVEDTLKALGDLAQAWRRKFSIPIIAIAGSNGKTTTKELTKAVLNTHFKLLATEGNLNNLIGVPKTLFRLGKEHEVAIIEVGMNDFGELARLTEITEPTAGLITNIGMEHLEKLGDLDGVARAEGELFAGLGPDATAIVNMEDARVAQLPTRAKKLGFGSTGSQIWGEVLNAQFKDHRPLALRVHIDQQEASLALQLPGPHNLYNVLAALAVGHYLGISLMEAKAALENFQPAPSRMEMVELTAGRKMIDDCYNANPSSTMAALQTLAQLKGKDEAMAILGEMLELGAYTATGHRQVGQSAAQEKIDHLLAIGEHAGEIRTGAEAAGMPPSAIRIFATPEEALASLASLPERLRWILVKGSRGIHLEKVVKYLKEHF
jgi:UDP-N-acetylmuramoyl-tripeptide--D-alanyl-D-alanine ligase